MSTKIDDKIAEIDAKIERLKIEKGVWQEAKSVVPGIVENPQVALKPPEKPKRKRAPRKDATKLTLQYFLDRDNKQASKRDISEEIGVQSGSVQNVLKLAKNGYEQIKVGDRNVEWKLKNSVYQKAKKAQQ